MPSVKPASSKAAVRRGRPRSAAAREAVLRAAREMLAEAGPSAVTIEGIATRAGVGKPTIYRWWSDRHAVAMEALMDAGAAPRAPAGARPPLEALRRQLETMADTFASRTGRSAAAMIAAADAGTELSRAFRNHFVLARREEGRALLEDARRRGEIRRDADLDIALDLVYGPFYFRLLLGHATPDRAFVRRSLRQALRGLAPSRSRAAAVGDRR